MPKYSKEPEFPCQECMHHMAAAKREMKQFADGHGYVATGTCDSTESPLKGLPLTGSFPASTNGEHNRVTRIGQKMTCFRPIRSV